MTSENIIEYIENALIPLLDRDRAEAILATNHETRSAAQRAYDRAHRAAMVHGEEHEAVVAVRKLQDAMWAHIWDSTQGQALSMSYVLARLGMGVATAHLVGTGEYGIEDYIALVKPWTSGYPDFPLPTKENE